MPLWTVSSGSLAEGKEQRPADHDTLGGQSALSQPPGEQSTGNGPRRIGGGEVSGLVRPSWHALLQGTVGEYHGPEQGYRSIPP